MSRSPSDPSLHLESGQELWNTLRQGLMAEISEASYKSWLMPLFVESYQDGVLTLSAPSRFMKDWVVSNYEPVIIRHLRPHTTPNIRIEIIVKPRKQESFPIKGLDSQLQDSKEAGASTASKDPLLDDHFWESLDPGYTFDAFVVGKSNELAYAASLRVAESQTPFYNPLFYMAGWGLVKPI